MVIDCVMVGCRKAFLRIWIWRLQMYCTIFDTGDILFSENHIFRKMLSRNHSSGIVFNVTLKIWELWCDWSKWNPLFCIWAIFNLIIYQPMWRLLQVCNPSRHITSFLNHNDTHTPPCGETIYREILILKSSEHMENQKWFPFWFGGYLKTKMPWKFHFRSNRQRHTYLVGYLGYPSRRIYSCKSGMIFILNWRVLIGWVPFLLRFSRFFDSLESISIF